MLHFFSPAFNFFPLKIGKEDVREKLLESRMSATIIFVVDLSQSVVRNIDTISKTIDWLSRQAYLYRDRIGLVALKGVKGVVIQQPTANLFLVKGFSHLDWYGLVTSLDITSAY